MTLVSKYKRLSKFEKRLLFDAYTTSIKVRYYIKFFKMPYYVKMLGEKSNKLYPSNYNEEKVITIIKNVKRVSRNSFWRTKCFEEAFNAKLLLQKHGIKSTIYFGVKKNKENKLDAHAWLTIGDKCIIGCNNINSYTITEFFS